MTSSPPNQTLFGIDTGEPIPHDLVWSYPVWDGYMAKVWSNLMCLSDFDRNGTVVEIAPGASPKLAMALAEMNFSGQVILIEAHPEIGKIALEFYRHHLPCAQCICIARLAEEIGADLPTNIAALVANHPLDDMLLLASVNHDESLRDLFDWGSLRGNTMASIELGHAAFYAAWEDLRGDTEKLNMLKRRTVSTWSTIIAHTRPRLTIVSQYPSATAQYKGLNDLSAAAFDILCELRSKYASVKISDDRIQAVLSQSINYGDPHIGYNVLNAAHWLVLESAI